MKLERPFYCLPLRFDAEKLAEEVRQLDESLWRPHPQGYAGNSALLLISSGGEQTNAAFGPMCPTPALEQCPYIRQVLCIFQTVIGRSRLMRLDGKSDVSPHADNRDDSLSEKDRRRYAAAESIKFSATTGAPRALSPRAG